MPRAGVEEVNAPEHDDREHHGNAYSVQALGQDASVPIAQAIEAMIDIIGKPLLPALCALIVRLEQA